MLNQVVLVGRISDLQNDYENGKEKRNVTLAIQRAFKNDEGIYETDFINVALWENENNPLEFCKVGDVVGVKGYLITEHNELIVKATKVTYLSSSKN